MARRTAQTIHTNTHTYIIIYIYNEKIRAIEQTRKLASLAIMFLAVHRALKVLNVYTCI